MAYDSIIFFLSTGTLLVSFPFIPPASFFALFRSVQVSKMPPFKSYTLAIVVMSFSVAQAAMGPAFSTGPVATNSWIREAESTLVLPKAPSGSAGDASLWVGMGTSNGDLIQSIADNYQSDNWSVFAYTLKSTGRKIYRKGNIDAEFDADAVITATLQMPIQAKGATANAGDHITMHCELPSSSKQAVSLSLIKSAD